LKAKAKKIKENVKKGVKQGRDDWCETAVDPGGGLDAEQKAEQKVQLVHRKVQPIKSGRDVLRTYSSNSNTPGWPVLQSGYLSVPDVVHTGGGYRQEETTQLVEN
jgi:hypothetical protein